MSLLVSAGPGLGKSALLDHTCATASDFTLLRVCGVATETDLPLAGLQRLLRPVEGELSHLPEDQRELVTTAMRRGGVTDGDRFALYTAVLDLLALLSRDQPVLLSVDDAHLLDSLSLDALAFAARRLDDTAVAIVFAAEAAQSKAVIPGVTQLTPAPLDERAVHDMLTDATSRILPAGVRAALVRASHGNPRAVLGYLASLAPDQLSGLRPLPDPLPLEDGLRDACLTAYRDLPGGTRGLLLLAALDTESRVHLLLRAAADPELSLSAFEPAEEAGLVRIEGDRIGFRDPLVREAVRQDASAARVRDAHRRMAAALDPAQEPARYVRHAAAGAQGPDTELAEELATAARAARRVDGPEAASLAGERAADLSPDPARRACLLASAAHQAWRAGRPHRSAALLARARPLAATERLKGVVELISAQVEMRNGNAIDAAESLTAAARQLIPHDRHLAIRALARAADAASLAGDPVRHGTAAGLVGSLVRPGDPPSMRLAASFLEGCASSFRGDYAQATPLLARAMELGDETDDPQELIWAGIAGLRLSNAPRVRILTTRAVESARKRGMREAIAPALAFLVFSEFWSGRFPSAAGTALSGLRIARETGQVTWVTQHLASLSMIAAIQGDADTCQLRARAVATHASENSLGLPAALSAWALAVLDLSRGNAAEAFFRLRALVHAGPGHGHPTMRLLTAPYFVEAAARMGELDWARTSLAGYRRWAEAIESTAALALAARGEGLLASGDAASEHFEEALRLHRLCGDDDVERARTQLLFGSALRRGRLPGRAREHLHDALESFERFGARLWIRQTRAELRAIGTAERRPESPPTDELTAQQQQIARLVAQGATNREVAAHMFISPRTVEHHLRGIFRKLNIRSRVELARLFN